MARHEMPAHLKLAAVIVRVPPAAGIRDDGKSLLFRSAIGKTRQRVAHHW
jgi:hypothetical protein